MIIKINFDSLHKEVLQAVDKAINDSLDILETSIEEKTPVKTWKYEEGHKKTKAHKVNNKIVWEVYNDMEYAKEVEYWFRKSPVNWHRNWEIIYNWIGARVYTRTLDENEKKIKDLISKAIKNAIK